MAVIKTVIDGNTKIHIMDDAYANKTPEEIRMQKLQFQRKINDLAFRIEMGEFDNLDK